tara:strand:+ start:118 stop:435 length:318 start_codon:yes stop_codon:yes gene_type:complete
MELNESTLNIHGEGLNQIYKWIKTEKLDKQKVQETEGQYLRLLQKHILQVLHSTNGHLYFTTNFTDKQQEEIHTISDNLSIVSKTLAIRARLCTAMSPDYEACNC